MQVAPAPSVPIVPAGPVACATVVYRDRGHLLVTAVVKATFALGNGAAMRLCEPAPIQEGDLAPYLPAADVLVVGTAHAPPGSQGVVRLLVAREAVLLAKACHAMEGFGPIARTAPARRDLISAEQQRALDQPVPEVLAGFDWRYFHAAPPDQRMEHLSGDELITLVGMHPTLPVVSAQLPGARGLARAYGIGASPERGRAVHLVADTLLIDTDAWRCSVTWRGSFTVPNEEILPLVRIGASLELSGAASDAAPDESSAITQVWSERTARMARLEQTLSAVLEAPPERDPAVLPFVPAAAQPGPPPRPSSPGELPGAPWSPGAPAPPVPRAKSKLDSTVDLGALVASAEAREQPSPADAWDNPAPPEMLQPLAPEPLVAPPGLGGPAIEPPDLSRPLPPQPPLQKPLAEVEEVRGMPLPPEPPLVRRPVPAPVAEPAAEAPADPYRPSEPEAAIAIAPAPPKPRSSIKGDLYKKFKR